MVTQSSGKKLIAAIETDSELKGEFQGGRAREAPWKEVVDLMTLDNWPTSKRKGTAFYASMKAKHADNSDRLACLEAGWRAFKDDYGIKARHVHHETRQDKTRQDSKHISPFKCF
jgi:hypothetical protein